MKLNIDFLLGTPKKPAHFSFDIPYFKFTFSPLSLPPKIITHWLQSFLKKPTCTGTN